MSLALIGIALAVVGNLWIIVLAFRTGLLWGLACLFLPPVGLIYCILNFRETWKPLLLAVVGWAAMSVSYFGVTTA
jgi:hypothetical protein